MAGNVQFHQAKKYPAPPLTAPMDSPPKQPVPVKDEWDNLSNQLSGLYKSMTFP
jgi:hypothetical protein